MRLICHTGWELSGMKAHECVTMQLEVFSFWCCHDIYILSGTKFNISEYKHISLNQHLALLFFESLVLLFNL